MKLDISLVPLDEIRKLRDLYRKEMNCQIVHDSWHERGFTDSYLIRVNRKVAGYGSVGAVGKKRKDTVKEYFLLAEHRGGALKIFRHIIEVSQATKVEAQTNDLLLTLMLFDCARRIKSDTILFHDAVTTSLVCSGGKFRRATDADQKRAFPHTVEPVGDWIIEADGEVAATGGILFHYNVPYGDIYMEVAEPFRRRGYGSYLVQELKRTCYEMGRVPAARCNVSNVASRATLQRAGFFPCARILHGVIS
jgi:GNAT superfamily N-acetyltransferase